MTEIQKAARIIQEGGLVAFPTETVYGLGADALNPYAVAAIFEAKSRPQFDPLIVHVGDLRQAEILVRKFPPRAVMLAEKFWPGPLTLVLPKSPRVPDIVTSALPTVALRVPRHPLALDLIRESGCPIAAPSANRFGQVSPTTAGHVRESLGDQVPLILDGGPCTVGVESTILSFAGDHPVLLRLGGTPLEEIQSLIGPVQVQTTAVEKPLARGPQTEGQALGARGQGSQPQNGPRPLSPGQLAQHYATRTPLVLEESLESLPEGKIGFLGLKEPPDPSLFAAVETLSKKGDLREAAANLFSAMRRLDEKGLDLIVAHPVPHEGLGRAINDRLYKAGHKSQF